MNFRTLLLILTMLPTLLWARDGHEQARIDFLIHGVETAQGLVFIRNGSDNGGAAAAKHLRMKLDAAGERIKTAEDFVKYCASESSLTHRKYMIRQADGSISDAATYFAAKLREFNDSKR